jgi:hypothetical protein
MIDLLLDDHLIQKVRRRRKRKIFSVLPVLSNIKGQLQKTEYNTRNAKDGGTSSVLRLKEI